MVGTYGFTLRVSDGCSTVDLPLSITKYPMPQITTATLPIASLNVPYLAQLQVVGGAPPYYWYTADPLPGGLTLNDSRPTSGSITPDSRKTWSRAYALASQERAWSIAERSK
jgi:hypothetical protein